MSIEKHMDMATHEHLSKYTDKQHFQKEINYIDVVFHWRARHLSNRSIRFLLDVSDLLTRIEAIKHLRSRGSIGRIITLRNYSHVTVWGQVSGKHIFTRNAFVTKQNSRSVSLSCTIFINCVRYEGATKSGRLFRQRRGQCWQSSTYPASYYYKFFCNHQLSHKWLVETVFYYIVDFCCIHPWRIMPILVKVVVCSMIYIIYE